MLSISPQTLAKLRHHRQLRAGEFISDKGYSSYSSPLPKSLPTFKLDMDLQRFLLAIECGGPPSDKGPGSGHYEHKHTATGQFHQHASLLKAFGWTKDKEERGQNPSNPKLKDVALKSVWSHPEHGSIAVDHMAHTFTHTDSAGSKIAKAPTGKNNLSLEQHLLDRKDDKPTSKQATLVAPKEPQKESTVSPKESKENAATKRNFTDAQLAKKLTDDRLMESIYGKGDWGSDENASFKANFDGHTLADKFRYQELNAQFRNSKDGQKTEVPAELAFKKYTSDSAYKAIPKGLDPDGLRAALKEKDLIAPAGTKGESGYVIAPSIHVSNETMLKGLSDKEKEAFPAMYAKHLTQLDADNKHANTINARQLKKAGFSEDQINKVSDAVEAAAKAAKLTDMTDYNQALPAACRDLWNHSANYETARTAIFSNWAVTGGFQEAQLLVHDAAARAFPVNQGVQFYDGGDKAKNSLVLLGESKKPVATDRLIENVKKLKQETEDFYKDKFSSKKNPNPDLTSIPLVAQRGVGGHVTAYTPSPAESWTTDSATAQRFGKMMGKNSSKYKKDGDYSILKTPSNYANVLWSYQSAAGKPGWPKEADLKGKKEFVLLGGSIKKVDAETF